MSRSRGKACRVVNRDDLDVPVAASAPGVEGSWFGRDTDVSDSAGTHVRQHIEEPGNERCDVLDAIRVRSEDHDRQPGTWNVLLVLELPIRRDERVEPGRRRAAEQLAVLHGRPPLCLDHPRSVPNEQRHQLSRQRLINEDAHGRPALRPRVRAPPWPARG